MGRRSHDPDPPWPVRIILRQVVSTGMSVILDLIAKAHAARVLTSLDALGRAARFTALRDRADVSDKQLTRALEYLQRQGMVAGRPLPDAGAPMEYRLTRLGAGALGVVQAWHGAVHGRDEPAFRAADLELEALGA